MNLIYFILSVSFLSFNVLAQITTTLSSSDYEELRDEFLHNNPDLLDPNYGHQLEEKVVESADSDSEGEPLPTLPEPYHASTTTEIPEDEEDEITESPVWTSIHDRNSTAPSAPQDHHDHHVITDHPDPEIDTDSDATGVWANEEELEETISTTSAPVQINDDVEDETHDPEHSEEHSTTAPVIIFGTAITELILKEENGTDHSADILSDSVNWDHENSEDSLDSENPSGTGNNLVQTVDTHNFTSATISSGEVEATHQPQNVTENDVLHDSIEKGADEVDGDSEPDTHTLNDEEDATTEDSALEESTLDGSEERTTDTTQGSDNDTVDEEDEEETTTEDSALEENTLDGTEELTANTTQRALLQTVLPVEQDLITKASENSTELAEELAETMALVEVVLHAYSAIAFALTLIAIVVMCCCYASWCQKRKSKREYVVNVEDQAKGSHVPLLL